jgi:tight adherence protein C
VFIAFKQNQRHAEILSSLPDALDLMVVCVEAGLGLGAALQRVGVEIRLASRQLSDELALVNQEMQTGIARSDALRNLAERTGVEDVYSLVAMLSQTDKLGTSVAKSLRAHAESMRTRRRQRAEQMARKASIKLAFPLVFLIFPALLLIILGPAGIQLMKALVNQE